MRPSAEVISSIKIARLPKKKLKLIQGCPITRGTISTSLCHHIESLLDVLCSGK